MERQSHPKTQVSKSSDTLCAGSAQNTGGIGLRDTISSAQLFKGEVEALEKARILNDGDDKYKFL